MVAIARTLPAPPELSSRWAAVLEEAEMRPRVLEIAQRFPEERSLQVPFAAVDGTDTQLADLLLEDPEPVLRSGQEAMRELLPVAGPEADGLRLRVTGLPATARRAVRAIREADLNRFIAIDGIVRKATEVRPQILNAVFACLACLAESTEVQEIGSTLLREPTECIHCGKPASKTRFRLMPERSTYLDTQRIEIQENPEALKGGAHPQGLQVLLTEDLTGKVIPGNRVVVNGVLRSLQRASASRTGLVRSTTFDLILHGNSLEYKQREYDELEISEEEIALFQQFKGEASVIPTIVASLAPTIKGMEDEKEAIALQLFGGVEKKHSDGIRVRGDIHVLLIGDPGTAKSQLLRYVADVAPRGVYTSGKGTTAAGLTAAAVKDDFAGGRWVLEAGMLVLADGGIAIVDELDKMSPEDRSAMHEALEQQTVSVSKAGITATLNARCPVLAAANPKWGRFSSSEPIGAQIDLPPTLLSRFDVIFSIQDRPEPERDRLLASRILLSAQEVESPQGEAGPGTAASSAGAAFPPDRLRKYISYARRTVRPVLTTESLSILEDFYVRVRGQSQSRQKDGKDAPVPITARQLEALVRLSEASARSRLSPLVSAEDARRATRIVERFLQRIASTEDGVLDIDIVNTGVARGQRERMEVLQMAMREIQESKGTFTKEEAFEAATRKGADPGRLEGLWLILRNQGELMETRPNLWQLVRF
ncbi:MAG TPA: minichromosome maintenance protein MCM [Thermoplasmata archaeon]|nr:minichromosome maintenance protein MCM [Thermoplasmata archaeon]